MFPTCAVSKSGDRLTCTSSDLFRHLITVRNCILFNLLRVLISFQNTGSHSFQIFFSIIGWQSLLFQILSSQQYLIAKPCRWTRPWSRLTNKVNFTASFAAFTASELPCAADNGGCSDICLSLPDQQRSCLCPLGKTLDEDQQTCSGKCTYTYV